MKKISLTLALLVGLPLALSAQVTKEDIKKLATAGISDEVILSYVKANGGVARLSADDVVELKQAGASEKLLTAVLSNAPAGPAAPAPAAAPAQEYRTYSAPSTTTYAYGSTPYYYTPSYDYYSSYTPTYYYPSYSYSSYYPRSYYYSSCYPRYYSPGISFGFSLGRSYSSRGSTGVHGYRR
jgi:hypothetical protein